ncbi:carbon monoxide dehydrogenase subunit G [Herbaspirillum sp. ST 5-3]|uniref:CoxG family protein n=1 Tax=Oxalobacteraceae TaxID=75682 RepID=UPI0010A51331|nr:carbon monoxide dehydrogenase subunit G [Herbaspirillum sp. ST 5-3]
MELIGEQLIGAPRGKVWEALNDPAILSRCIPGCEEINKISEAETHTRVMLKIGPVRARFSGKIFMTDMEAPAKCTLSFEGAGGAAGFAKGRSAVALAEEGTGTRLTYSVEASVGGKLGQIGGRLIDSSAKKMADEFFAAFDAALQSPAQAATVPTADITADAAHVNTPSTVSAPTRPATTPLPVQVPFAGGGFQHELYRFFWFGIGVAFTLLTTRWLS